MTAAGHGQSYGIGLHTTAGPGQYLTELDCYIIDAGGSWTGTGLTSSVAPLPVWPAATCWVSG